MQEKTHDLTLDDLDKRILKELQKDAGQSFADLGLLVHASAPTCQRRVARLEKIGLIQRKVALLDPDTLRLAIGTGLIAILEVSLSEQNEESWTRFEQKTLQLPEVTQCYRVSSGPDFVLVIHISDMPHYQRMSQRLLNLDSAVRSVKSYFSTKRVKFSTEIPV